MKLMTQDPAMMLRDKPGTVRPWIRWLVATACVVTVFALWLGGEILVHELAWFDEKSMGQFWLRHGVAYAAAFAIIMCVLPGSRLSRAIHAAIALPIIHAAFVVVGWLAWRHELPVLSSVSDARMYAASFPMLKAALAAIAGAAGFAGLIARRRRGEWAHSFVMLSLSFLLLVGLWMPIALQLWGQAGSDIWVTDGYARYMTTPLPNPVGMTLLVVLPPLVAAMAFTALAIRRASWLRTHRSKLIASVIVLLLVSCTFRLGAEARPMVLYSNFIPLLLVGVLVAVTSLVVLAVAMLVGPYRVRRRFVAQERMVGVIQSDSKEPVFAIEIASWLRGPRLFQRSFEIATSQGTIPVTGAELVAPLPATTTLLRSDDVHGLLYVGDTVIVAGHRSDEAGPFRSSSAPLSGSLYIAPEDVERAGLASAALAMWRPCVAYLLIVTAIALPGFAALLAG